MQVQLGPDSFVFTSLQQKQGWRGGEVASTDQMVPSALVQIFHLAVSAVLKCPVVLSPVGGAGLDVPVALPLREDSC